MSTSRAADIARDAADGLGLRGFATVNVAGRPIRIRTVGDGGRPPCVLLHGFAADALSWARVQEPLADQAGRRVIAVELPGHGGSDPDVGEGHVETMAAAVVDTVHVLGITRLHLVGHSYGGAIASLVADRMPHTVASLALIAPSGFGLDGNMAFFEQFVAAESPAALKVLLSPFYDQPDTVLTDAVVDLVFAHKSDPAVAAALGKIAADVSGDAFHRTKVRKAAARYAGPAKLIWGTADPQSPVHHAWGMPPHFGLHTIAGMRHAPHIERPALVIRLLAELAAIE